VAVEKLVASKLAKIKSRQDAATNDVLSFPGHFLSPKFTRLGRKGSFSTATPVNKQLTITNTNSAHVSGYGPALSGHP
jgi:hypothetical protein